MLKDFLFLGGFYVNSFYLYLKAKSIYTGEPHICVAKDTTLCVEGFQRSGNGYCEAILKYKNKDLEITHHAHAFANIKRSVQWNVPILVLVRNPIDCIASLITFDERLSDNIAIGNYIRYYRAVERYKDQILIIEFSQLTEAPDVIIEKVNQKYSMNLNKLNFSAEEQAEYLKYKKANYDQAILASPFPDDAKKPKTDKHRTRLFKNPKMKEALRLYEKLGLGCND